MNGVIKSKQTTTVLVVFLGFAWFGLLPAMLALNPPPDGGYPNATAVQDDSALDPNENGESEQLPFHPTFFSGAISLGLGVWYLQWFHGNIFGYFVYLPSPNWIYHFDMGYEYYSDPMDGQRSIYFYDFASGHFFYTSPSYPFPYLYDFSLNTMLYYYPDTHRPGHYTTNPRYFYNFATHQIITM